MSNAEAQYATEAGAKPKKKWDNPVSNYVDKLHARSALNIKYARAGLTQEHLAEVASTMLYKMGIDIDANDLVNGGSFMDKDDISVYHAKKDRWIKGRTAQKGFVSFYNDGGPVLTAYNYPNGEELIKKHITLEDCAEHLPGFSMYMINEKGLLKPEYVPKDHSNIPAVVVDPEARARQDAERKEKRIKDEADRRQKRLDGAAKIQDSVDKAVAAHANIVASGNNIEPHANHLYLQNKYGEDLPHYAPYLKSLIASDITFASWAKPDEVYPLYQPGYDIETGQMTALQRTLHDAIPDKTKKDAKGRTLFVKQFKEDGTPKIVKKFASGTNGKNAATPVFNAPSDSIKNFYLSEGITTGATWAMVMDMANDPKFKDDCVLSCYNAANIAKVAADLREKHPKANLVIVADNDFQTPNNDGQKYAAEAREESGAVVVTPPVGYLKDGQSDWDDVAKNIRDALTMQAQKEHGPTAKASFDSVRNVTKRIMETEYLQALNSVIEETDDLIQRATETIENRQSPSLPKTKDASLLMANQDPEFKRLTSSVFKIAGLLDHSKDWTMPNTITSILNNIDLDGTQFKSLAKPERKEVMRDASAVLVDVLTSGKTHNSLGIENTPVITALAQEWDAHPAYTKAFLSSLESNIKPGKQQASEPEPTYVTDFTHGLVKEYRQSVASRQAQAAQASVDPKPDADESQVAEPEQPKPTRRSP